MSPLCPQSNTFLPSGELNSDPFWVDGATCSTLREETFRLFEGSPTTFDGSAVQSTHHLFPLFDDGHLGPPLTSGGAERVDDADFTLFAPSASLDVQHDDFFGHTYQATYFEFPQNETGTCVPAQVMAAYEHPQQALTPWDDSVASITETLSATHLLSMPVAPSTMTTYVSSFDHNRVSQTLPTSRNASIVCPPPVGSLAPSLCGDGLESDGELGADYVPPSGDDEHYLSSQATSSREQKHKVCTNAKATSLTASPAHTSSSESGRSVTSSRSPGRARPYKRPVAFRNFQSEDAAGSFDELSDFRCPVAGCGRKQKNGRIPDLKRHILTHGHWLKPDKWTCCGVPTENAHLYGIEIEPGMTEEELIEVGACRFKGKLMIGGCLRSFARRDALKRHIDNEKLPCIGDMDSYAY